jgi:hypothetical protein
VWNHQPKILRFNEDTKRDWETMCIDIYTVGSYLQSMCCNQLIERYAELALRLPGRQL